MSQPLNIKQKVISDKNPQQKKIYKGNFSVFP